MKTFTKTFKIGKVALFMAALMVGTLAFESCSSGGKSGTHSKAKSKNDRIKRNTNFMTY